MECLENDFLVQILDKLTRERALLSEDMVLISAEELIEVKIGSSLGCSDYMLVEFVISRNMILAESGP